MGVEADSSLDTTLYPDQSGPRWRSLDEHKISCLRRSASERDEPKIAKIPHMMTITMTITMNRAVKFLKGSLVRWLAGWLVDWLASWLFLIYRYQ